MGIVLAVLALISRYLPVFGVRGMVIREQPAATMNLREAVRTTFSNSQFLAFMPAFVLFTMAQVMLTALLPFFVDVVLRDTTIELPLVFLQVTFDETGEMVSFLAALYFLPLLVSVPLMSRLAARRSKRWTYGAAMLVTGLVFPLMFFVGFLPGIPKLAQALFLMSLGVPLAALFVFPNALLADVIDYDAAHTGTRREAVYYGIQATLQKAGFGLASAVLALVLFLFGKTEADPLGIRLVGPVAGAFVLLGYAVFVRGYRLSDEARIVAA